MVTAPGSHQQTVARVKAVVTLGCLAFYRSDQIEDWLDGRLTKWLDESIVLAEELGERRLHAYAALYQGMLAWNLDDWPTADAFLTDSLRLFRESGDRMGLAIACNLNGLATLWGTRMSDHPSAPQRKNLERARGYFLESRSILADIGEPWYASAALSFLGMIAYEQGNYSEVEAYFSERWLLSEEQNNFPIRAICLHWLGKTALRSGDYARAQKLLEAAVQTYQAIPWGPRHHETVYSLLQEAKRQAEEEYPAPHSLNGFQTDYAPTE
jgi:tetratricopeptide (TPR) repeat protein